MPGSPRSPSKLSLGTSLPTSGRRAAPGPHIPHTQLPRSQRYSSAGGHQSQAPQALQPAHMGPSPTYQWAGTSPWILRSYSQSTSDMTLTTSG